MRRDSISSGGTAVVSDTPVITVDGPSGTGKGTLASKLAHWLGWHFLDSGALYRVLALAAQQHKVNIEDEDSVTERFNNIVSKLS